MADPVSDDTIASLRKGISESPAKFGATAAMMSGVLARLDTALAES